ncbi:hypothetical protein JOM56_006409, partial [Amanita muscaria]
YQYVCAALLSTTFVLAYQVFLVMKYRQRARIQYPQLYAEKSEAEANPEAKKFNCAQRAHHNTLENLPMIYIPTLVTGLKYPLFAAVACTLWSLSRISYTHGYITGNPDKVCVISIQRHLSSHCLQRLTLLYRVGTIGVLGKCSVKMFVSWS